MEWFVLGILLSVAVYDVYRYLKKKRTLSQIVHAWFPAWIDFIVMVALLVATWAIWGVRAFIPVVLGVIIGHLFWYGE